jgi:TRAP-type C4-dicarboxylate transport system permease small subunit
MSFWTKYSRWVAKISLFLAVISLLIMMSLVTANVIMRGIFSEPILGTVEIVGLAGVLLISFALGFTEREQAHVTVMIMVGRLPQRLQSIFILVALFLSMVVVVVLFWAGVLQFWEAVVTPETMTYVLHVPLAPFFFVWLCGCVVLFIFLLGNFTKELVRARKR